MDTISSGYRDGLDGGRDWRRLFPICLIFIAVSLFAANFLSNLPETYFIFVHPIFLSLFFCVFYFRPCKTKAMNVSLSFHLIITALTSLTLALWIQNYFLSSFTLEIFLSVCLSLPHVVMLLWLLRHIVTRCQSLRNCCLKTKQVCFGRAQFLLHRFE